MAAGLWFVIDIPRLIRSSVAHWPIACGGIFDPAAPVTHPARVTLLMIIAAGFVARVILFASHPILEDDYHRYLWDGGVTAAGLNPYTDAPTATSDLLTSPAEGASAERRLALARDAGSTLERINHPELKTIYPPFAQVAFAVAHHLSPWSLTAWRIVCLAADTATLALLLTLLSMAGRSQLWIAIYWWNPLVLKELFNSAHMEAVLIPFVLLSLTLSLRNRPTGAMAALALAAGVKVWPVLLVPLILRPYVATPGRLFVPLAIFAVILAAMVYPIVAGGLDETSGFVAYATFWQTNSALFPIVNGAMTAAIATINSITGLDIDPDIAGRLTRVVFAGVVISVAIAVGGGRMTNAPPLDVLRRAAIICLAMVLFSPAQFPWYMTWMLPLAVFLPLNGVIAVTAVVPFYYAAFHFHFNDSYEGNKLLLASIIWVPVWLALVRDARRCAIKKAESRSDA